MRRPPTGVRLQRRLHLRLLGHFQRIIDLYAQEHRVGSRAAAWCQAMGGAGEPGHCFVCFPRAR